MPAHNEENTIGDCLSSLMEMNIPQEVDGVEYVVIDDRCEDNTGRIAESMGAKVLTKRFRGEYVSAIAEAVAYGVENTNGELILKCDADVITPKNALNGILRHLDMSVGRVSSEVRTRTGRWWLDFLMWLRDLNFHIAPLGESPRGAFTLFRREVVNEVGGFDRGKPTWDTAFDIRLRQAGYDIKKANEVTVLELRKDLTARRIIRHQIEAGRARSELGVGFRRTLLHSIFRGRFFVLYGYLHDQFMRTRKPILRE